MEGIKLIKIGFDSLENRNPEYEEELAVFVDSPERNRYLKLQDYLHTLTYTPYAGYDHKIYPQFRVEKIKIQ